VTAVAEDRAAHAPRPSRWVLVAAAVLLLAVLVTPALFVVLTGEDGETSDTLRVARLPTDVAVAGDTVWVVSGRDDRILAVDPEQTDGPAASHETGSAPLRVAVGAGSVWTANAGDGSVTRLNPLVPESTGRRIAIGADAVDVAVGPDGAWVSNGQRGTVMRIDPISNRPQGPPIRTGAFPTALALGANHLWVVNSGDGTVARVDLVVGRRVPVGRDPQDIAVGFGSVWVANRGDGTVTQIDAATGRVQGDPISAGEAPAALAVTRDAVLVLDGGTGDVLELVPESRAARRVLSIPGFPSSIAVGGGAAWIVDSRAGTVTRIDG
jgi:DNA-binding beta-propeller fold protein YncE